MINDMLKRRKRIFLKDHVKEVMEVCGRKKEVFSK